jgi:hypothetical protein
LDNWIYCTLYIRDYRQLQRYRWSTHFTVHRYTGIGFSVFTSRVQAHHKSHMKCSFHSLIHFLPFLLNHLRLPSPELDSILDNSPNDLLRPFITPRHGTRRKHSLSIVEKASLPIRCLVMNVLLLRAYESAGMCLPSPCLAMGLYVTI